MDIFNNYRDYFLKNKILYRKNGLKFPSKCLEMTLEEDFFKKGLDIVNNNKILFWLKILLPNQDEYFCAYCGNKINVNKNTYISRELDIFCNKREFYDRALERRIKTTKEIYGCENVGQNIEIKEKIKNVYIEKYGCHPCKTQKVKNKIKQSNIEKFGCENVFQNEEVKKKIKQTLLKNYGVEYPLQNKELLAKAQQTNLERFGETSAARNESIKEKTAKTCIEKYGVKAPSMNPDIVEKSKQTCLKRYGVTSKNKLSSYKEERSKKYYEDIEKFKKENDIILVKDLLEKYDAGWYINKVVKINLYKNNIGYIKKEEEIKIINYVKNIKKYSYFEMSFYDFLKTQNISFNKNNRKIIYPLELDVVISSNLAIELNGGYFHDFPGKDKNYHLNKTLLCEKQNIDLIHIFQSDWVCNRAQCESLILRKLNLCKQIQFKDCNVLKIKKENFFSFLKENSFYYVNKPFDEIKGIFYGKELIAVVSLKKIKNKIYIQEFSIKNYINIKNFLSNFLYMENLKNVYLYIDRSKFFPSDFEGKFKIVRHLKPNYFLMDRHYEKIEKNSNIKNLKKTYDCGKTLLIYNYE